jgi:hypothetical protein
LRFALNLLQPRPMWQTQLGHAALSTSDALEYEASKPKRAAEVAQLEAQVEQAGAGANESRSRTKLNQADFERRMADLDFAKPEARAKLRLLAAQTGKIAAEMEMVGPQLAEIFAKIRRSETLLPAEQKELEARAEYYREMHSWKAGATAQQLQQVETMVETLRKQYPGMGETELRIKALQAVKAPGAGAAANENERLARGIAEAYYERWMELPENERAKTTFSKWAYFQHNGANEDKAVNSALHKQLRDVQKEAEAAAKKPAASGSAPAAPAAAARPSLSEDKIITVETESDVSSDKIKSWIDAGYLAVRVKKDNTGKSQLLTFTPK